MKKLLFGLCFSMFLLLQGCSAMMALSGSQNPDFKVINAKYGNDNGIDHMLKNEKTGELIITPIEMTPEKIKK